MVFIALGLSFDLLISQPGHAETDFSFYLGFFSFKAVLLVFTVPCSFHRDQRELYNQALKHYLKQ